MVRWLACLLLLSSLVAGEIITSVEDGLGDGDAVFAAQQDPKVEAFRADLDEVAAQLLKLKQRDLLAMFGPPARRHEGWEHVGDPWPGHALPVAQPRAIGLSGERYAEEAKNKDHADFYGCGLEVYYDIDGVTPSAIVFWLPVDANLPRLGPNNLAARLQWDRAKWNDLVAAIEKRRAVAFPLVVDVNAETKFYEGVYSNDRDQKLAAWKIEGERLGYSYKQWDENGRRHCWYRADKTRAFEAVVNGRYATFSWYDATGWNELRREDCGGSWHWCRPGPGAHSLRAERSVDSADRRPHEWLWWDKADRVVRHELDDNGDGIPDLYDGKLPAAATDDHEEEWRPLEMDRSWAVHPELIPEDCRIPDQPDRRVPVRKRE